MNEQAPCPPAGTREPGTVYFVSRHPGALAWARDRGIRIDSHLAHLDGVALGGGDTVIGTLPMHLAARVCASGARFLNLTVDIPADSRGRELGARELEAFGARLEEFRVERVGKSDVAVASPHPESAGGA